MCICVEQRKYSVVIIFVVTKKIDDEIRLQQKSELISIDKFLDIFWLQCY